MISWWRSTWLCSCFCIPGMTRKYSKEGWLLKENQFLNQWWWHQLSSHPDCNTVPPVYCYFSLLAYMYVYVYPLSPFPHLFPLKEMKLSSLLGGTSVCSFGGKKSFPHLSGYLSFVHMFIQLVAQTLVRTARWLRNKTYLLYQRAVLCFVCARGH